IESRLLESQYDFIFLCSPDVDWEADPLRENPDDRDRLFELYKENLNALKWDYYSLLGSKKQRLEKALEIISV
ncbi:MAG: AAA family ATPase, partial [Bacteroidota bacterium]